MLDTAPGTVTHSLPRQHSEEKDSTPMAATKTKAPAPIRRGEALPHREKQRLQALQRIIRQGERAWEERAERMAALRAEGYALDAIAEGAGINRESVRKAIMRRTPE